MPITLRKLTLVAGGALIININRDLNQLKHKSLKIPFLPAGVMLISHYKLFHSLPFSDSTHEFVQQDGQRVDQATSLLIGLNQLVCWTVHHIFGLIDQHTSCSFF